MNILLLGNGYDLNYKLPTLYHNFLLTVDFLTKCNLESIHTVGDVFGNSKLQKEDEFITESFDLYKDIYNDVSIDPNTLHELVNRAKRNMWFSYFQKSFNRDAGWIDFEKEIAFIISKFRSFFDKAGVTFVPNRTCKETGSKYIIMEMFNFFVANCDYYQNSLQTGSRRIKPEYTTEYPLGSKDYIINKEKIIDTLYDALLEFVDILKTYLQCFIDKTVEKLVKQGKITHLQALNHQDIVITFNYTNTYECFDSTAQVFHVHGNVNEKLVLGINPDKSDEIETIDTAFIKFKKYYQRTYYGTDISYLRWSRDLFDADVDNSDIHLLVMGHSLDITDEDFIRNLFCIASEITVLYHSESSKSNLIRNLVNIFGKDEFDQLRDEQRLEFLPLNIDFSAFSKKMAENSSIRYESTLRELL